MKKILKLIGIIIFTIMIIVLTYVIYVLVDYTRLEDNINLNIKKAKHNTEEIILVNNKYRIASYNVGFGAYSDDYSFFMDGGKESRAKSKKAVNENLGGAIKELKKLNSDFLLIQEIDEDGDRSWHVNEKKIIEDNFDGFDSVYAQNYDSPYLFWPLNEPHGANKAGLMLLSNVKITSAIRRSLPIEKGLMKFIDLDRCYSINRMPVNNGKELVIFGLHLSAYTSDGAIAEKQLEMLGKDMEAEIGKGNYVIAGGDFNKDILGNSSKVFGQSNDEYTWAQPISDKLIPKGMKKIAPVNKDKPVPSCRNADRPYGPDDYVVTVDGFIVSENIAVKTSTVLDTKFRWSDHNPVYMDFILIN